MLRLKSDTDGWVVGASRLVGLSTAVGLLGLTGAAGQSKPNDGATRSIERPASRPDRASPKTAQELELVPKIVPERPFTPGGYDDPRFERGM